MTVTVFPEIEADPEVLPDVLATVLLGVNVPVVLALPDFHLYTILPAPPLIVDVPPPAAMPVAGLADIFEIVYVAVVIQSGIWITVNSTVTFLFLVIAEIVPTLVLESDVFAVTLIVIVVVPLPPDTGLAVYQPEFAPDKVQSVLEVTVNEAVEESASKFNVFTDMLIEGSTPPLNNSLRLLSIKNS